MVLLIARNSISRLPARVLPCVPTLPKLVTPRGALGAPTQLLQLLGFLLRTEAIPLATAPQLVRRPPYLGIARSLLVGMFCVTYWTFTTPLLSFLICLVLSGLTGEACIEVNVLTVVFLTLHVVDVLHGAWPGALKAAMSCSTTPPAYHLRVADWVGCLVCCPLQPPVPPLSEVCPLCLPRDRLL